MTHSWATKNKQALALFLSGFFFFLVQFIFLMCVINISLGPKKMVQRVGYELWMHEHPSSILSTTWSSIAPLEVALDYHNKMYPSSLAALNRTLLTNTSRHYFE